MPRPNFAFDNAPHSLFTPTLVRSQLGWKSPLKSVKVRDALLTAATFGLTMSL
jgi:hypothetical protein